MWPCLSHAFRPFFARWDGRTPLSSACIISCLPGASLLHSLPRHRADITSVWYLSQNPMQVWDFVPPSSLGVPCCSPPHPKCKSKDGVKGSLCCQCTAWSPAWGRDEGLSERDSRCSPCLILNPGIQVVWCLQPFFPSFLPEHLVEVTLAPSCLPKTRY